MVESNALAKSVYIMSTDPPSSIMLVKVSIVNNKFVIQSREVTKPCWSLENRLFLTIYSRMESLIIDSIILHITEVRLTGL